MDGVNGIPSIQMANPLVQMLEAALQQVKAGQVNSVAVILVANNGALSLPFGGPNLMNLFTAAELLALDIRDQMKADQQRGGRPGILRAMPG